MLVVSQAVNDKYLPDADFICGGKTRVWGYRPPDPPLKGGTPPLKLSCVRFGLWEAECGVRSILDFSWKLLDWNLVG